MTNVAAMYLRFSSDMQRDSSIEDQERRCRERTEREGWPVNEDFVLADRAISGTTTVGRSGLEKLLSACKLKPRPFDILLVDHTSRFARDAGDLLQTMKRLEFNGIRIVVVGQGLDSSQPYWQQALLLNGFVDEQYIVSLRDQVRRGQEGRAF